MVLRVGVLRVSGLRVGENTQHANPQLSIKNYKNLQPKMIALNSSIPN